VAGASEASALHLLDGTALAPPPPKGRRVKAMATKSRPSAEPKKPGRSLKEKRQAKQAKQAARKQARGAK